MLVPKFWLLLQGPERLLKSWCCYTSTKQHLPEQRETTPERIRIKIITSLDITLHVPLATWRGKQLNQNVKDAGYIVTVVPRRYTALTADLIQQYIPKKNALIGAESAFLTYCSQCWHKPRKWWFGINSRIQMAGKKSSGKVNLQVDINRWMTSARETCSCAWCALLTAEQID